MAHLSLAIVWDDDEGESKRWVEDVSIDYEHIKQDPQYAETVSDYLGRGLAYLATEAELIKGSNLPEGPDCG